MIHLENKSRERKIFMVFLMCFVYFYDFENVWLLIILIHKFNGRLKRENPNQRKLLFYKVKR